MYDPKERPSFSEIVAEIKNFIFSAERILKSEVPTDSTYLNMPIGKYYNVTEDMKDRDSGPAHRSIQPVRVNKPRVEVTYL